MQDREKVISTLEEIKTQTAEIGLDSAVIAHEFIDKFIALLKEKNGLMLALEQSNAVNGFLNAEVERLNGLLKKPQEIVRCKDCKYWWYENYCEKHGKGQENADWFCADGESKEVE